MPRPVGDRNKAGLRGSVKKVRTEWVSGGGPPVEEQVFDRAGRLISLRVWDSNRREHYIRFDDIEDAGQSGRDRGITRNSDGKMIEIQNLLAKTTWSIECLPQCAFATWGAALARTEYSAEGTPIETVFEDDQSQELHRIRYVCDANGNILQAVQYGTSSMPRFGPAPITPPGTGGTRGTKAEDKVARDTELIRVSFRYDDAGRVTEQKTHFGGQPIHHIVNIYNDQGDIIMSTQDGKPARFEYKYDHHGNWIEKNAYYPAPNPPARCRRTIQYDDE